MERRELQKKSIGELLELAVQNKVPVRENMDKTELVNTIHKSMTGHPASAASMKTEESCQEEAVEKESERELELEAEVPDMQQAVEESKYFTGQPEPPVFGIPAELPYHYNDDKVALLVRDPHWVYSYWEVTPRKLDMARAELGDGQGALALRVYDVTDLFFDGANAHSFYDIGVYDTVGDWYVNTGEPGRSFIMDLGLKAPDGRFITLARSNAIRTPRDTVSDVLDEEWVIAEEQFQRIFALSGGYSVGLSSAELALAGARRLEFGAASPGMGSMALMSPGLRMKKERGFWFSLNAELIVYGATEPEAEVTILGKQIKLRPDGTFTLRFALPDGRQAVPVSFTSADKAETHWITPEVTRETKTN